LGVLAFAVAHRLAYLLGEASQHSHGAPAWHGYLPVVEVSAAAIALVALVLFGAAVWRSGASREELPFRRPLHLLGIYGIGPATLFVFAEFCERSFDTPPGLLLLIGVGLQLALGCAVLLWSRRVLRVVVALAGGGCASSVPGRMAAARRQPPRWLPPRAVLIGLANQSRAPPAA